MLQCKRSYIHGMFAAALFRDGINLRNIENIVAKFISQTMTQP